MEYEAAVIPTARVNERVRDELDELLTDDTENGLSTEQENNTFRMKLSALPIV